MGSFSKKVLYNALLGSSAVRRMTIYLFAGVMRIHNLVRAVMK
jgi:hypothetical protein